MASQSLQEIQAGSNLSTRKNQASDKSKNLNPISVCLLISSLEYGGAERQVVEMMHSFEVTRVRAIVCALSKRVPLTDCIANRDAWLHIIEKQFKYDFTTVFRVALLLRRQKIDVLHAFLFDSEIIARLAAPLAGVPVVIASERNADYVSPLIHKIFYKLTRSLFTVMVANSNAGKRHIVKTQQLTDSRVEVVHNGVDVNRFRPDCLAGQMFRFNHGIPAEDCLIGMVGSYKRQKGHDYFLRMASRVSRSIPNSWFFIVGGVISKNELSNAYSQEIKRMAASLGLAERCRFIENQNDMAAFYNACDFTVLLSRHEGTPNVVLESMACGVPVIVSDVADNASIVTPESGWVVPAGNHDAAAQWIENTVSDITARKRMALAARHRICSKFSLETASYKLEDIYRKCLQQKTGRPPS